MKSAFHYLVRVKQLRLKSPGKIDFIEIDEKFEDDDSLLARNRAFAYYHTCLDLLLAEQALTYTTEAEAQEGLKNFSSQNHTTPIQIGNRVMDFSNSFGLGIGVFFVIDKPSKDYTFEDHAGDECLIHGFGGLGWADDVKSIMLALGHEYWYYHHYHVEIGELKQSVSFYEYDIAQSEVNRILATPFDWSGFNKPYSEKFQENVFRTVETEMLAELIKSGESNQVEFKPSLLFNHKTGKGGISIKGIIAKTICAMLNSNGGILFIGISSKSEVQGLQYDYSLAGTKKPRDYFQLEFDQMLEHFLSLSVKSNISGQFLQMEGKDLFVVTVISAKHRPIFLNGQEGKEFYVRTGVSSRHITDIEEIANYCIDTWTS